MPLPERRPFLLVALLVLVPSVAAAQVDDRLDRLRTHPSAARAFAFDLQPDAPIAVAQVEELRQQNPPHRYAATLFNRSTAPVASLTAAVCVVASDGSLKGIDRLPTVKNLQPGQSRRLETVPHSTSVSLSDRVVFVLAAAEDGQGGRWHLTDEEIASRIKEAAASWPPP
jgi:hypothetical protein